MKDHPRTALAPVQTTENVASTLLISTGIEAILSPRSTSSCARNGLSIGELYDERRSLRREWIRFLDSVDSEDSGDDDDDDDDDVDCNCYFDNKDTKKDETEPADQIKNKNHFTNKDVELCYPTVTNTNLCHIDSIFSGSDNVEDEDREEAQDDDVMNTFHSLKEQVESLDSILEELSALPNGITNKDLEIDDTVSGSQNIHSQQSKSENLFNDDCDTFEAEWNALNTLENELREELKSVSIEMESKSYYDDGSRNNDPSKIQDKKSLEGDDPNGEHLEREERVQTSKKVIVTDENGVRMTDNYNEGNSSTIDHVIKNTAEMKHLSYIESSALRIISPRIKSNNGVVARNFLVERDAVSDTDDEEQQSQSIKGSKEEPSTSAMILDYVLNTELSCAPQACAGAIEADQDELESIGYRIMHNKSVVPSKKTSFPETPISERKNHVKRLRTKSERNIISSQMESPSTSYRFTSSELKHHTNVTDTDADIGSSQRSARVPPAPTSYTIHVPVYTPISSSTQKGDNNDFSTRGKDDEKDDSIGAEVASPPNPALRLAAVPPASAPTSFTIHVPVSKQTSSSSNNQSKKAGKCNGKDDTTSVAVSPHPSPALRLDAPPPAPILFKTKVPAFKQELSSNHKDCNKADKSNSDIGSPSTSRPALRLAAVPSTPISFSNNDSNKVDKSNEKDNGVGADVGSPLIPRPSLRLAIMSSTTQVPAFTSTSPSNEKGRKDDVYGDSRDEKDVKISGSTIFVIPESVSSLTQVDLPKVDSLDFHSAILNEILFDEEESEGHHHKSGAKIDDRESKQMTLHKILSEEDDCHGTVIEVPLVQNKENGVSAADNETMRAGIGSPKTQTYTPKKSSPALIHFTKFSEILPSIGGFEFLSPASLRSPVAMKQGLPFQSPNLSYELDAISDASLDLMSVSFGSPLQTAVKQNDAADDVDQNQQGVIQERSLAERRDVTELEIMGSEIGEYRVSPLNSPIAMDATNAGTINETECDQSIDHVVGRVYARTRLSGGVLVLDEGLQASLARIATRSVKEDPVKFKNSLFEEEAERFKHNASESQGIEVVLTDDAPPSSRNMGFCSADPIMDLLSEICCRPTTPPSELVHIISGEEKIELIQRGDTPKNSTSETIDTTNRRENDTVESKPNSPDATDGTGKVKDVALSSTMSTPPRVGRSPFVTPGHPLYVLKGGSKPLPPPDRTRIQKVNEIQPPPARNRTHERNTPPRPPARFGNHEGSIPPRPPAQTIIHEMESSIVVEEDTPATVVSKPLRNELLTLNQKLFESMQTQDFGVFSDLTTEGIFGVTSGGDMVHGRDAYWKSQPNRNRHKESLPPKVSMEEPFVQELSPGVLVVVYSSVERADGDSAVVISKETRIWKKSSKGSWKNCHFHRSSRY